MKDLDIPLELKEAHKLVENFIFSRWQNAWDTVSLRNACRELNVELELATVGLLSDHRLIDNIQKS